VLAVLLIAGLFLFLATSPLRAVGQAPLLAGEEQALLDLINTYRAQNGLSALNVSPTLTDAARWMSQDMADNNYFSHTDSLGRDPFQRMADFGYGFNTWKGENLAAGSQTASETFELWRSSPGHNANILRAEFTVVGIGRAYGPNSTYGWYWTNDFGVYDDSGSPPPTATPGPTETPVPTPTTPPPTRTVTPTPTPTPEPSPTSTPEATETAEPTPTMPLPTPTDTPMVTPTQEPSPTPASEPPPSVIPSPQPTEEAPPATGGLRLEPGTNLGLAPPTRDEPPGGQSRSTGTTRELVPGWNRIESAGGGRLAEALPVDDGKLMAVYAWDPERGGRWRRYLAGVNIPGLNTLTELTGGQTVWILATQRVVVTLPA